MHSLFKDEKEKFRIKIKVFSGWKIKWPVVYNVILQTYKTKVFTLQNGFKRSTAEMNKPSEYLTQILLSHRDLIFDETFAKVIYSS